jgi:hypothetical protein
LFFSFFWNGEGAAATEGGAMLCAVMVDVVGFGEYRCVTYGTEDPFARVSVEPSVEPTNEE